MQRTDHTEERGTSVADLIAMSLKEREAFFARLNQFKAATH